MEMSASSKVSNPGVCIVSSALYVRVGCMSGYTLCVSESGLMSDHIIDNDLCHRRPGGLETFRVLYSLWVTVAYSLIHGP